MKNFEPNINTNYWISWKRYLKELTFFKKDLFIIIFCSILSAVLYALSIFASVKLLLNSEIKQNAEKIIWVSVLLGFFIVINIIIYFLKKLLSRNLSIKIEVSLRKKMMDHVHNLPEIRVHLLHIGAFFSRMMSDLKEIKSFTKHLATTFINTLVLTVIGIVFIFIIDWRFALIFLVVFSIPLIIYYWRYKKITYHRQVAKLKNTEIHISLGERLSRLNEIKIKNQSKLSIDNFNKKQHEYENIWTKINKRLSLLELLGFLFSLIMSNVLVVIAYYVFGIGLGENGANDQYFLLSSVNIVVLSTKDIPGFLNEVITVNASIVRYNEFFEWETEGVGHEKPLMNGHIDIKNLYLNFQMKGEKNVILNNINMNIRPGDTIIINNKNFGKGKSSLLKALLGFYETERNMIFFNGVDIKDIDLPYLRENISYVSSAPNIFSQKFRSQIMTKENEKELNHYLKELKMEDLYYKFFEDHEDENAFGIHISFSEKKMIAFLEACLENKNIIFLDSIFDGLSDKQKSLIQNVLDTDFKHKTVIMVNS